MPRRRRLFPSPSHLCPCGCGVLVVPDRVQPRKVFATKACVQRAHHPPPPPHPCSCGCGTLIDMRGRHRRGDPARPVYASPACAARARAAQAHMPGICCVCQKTFLLSPYQRSRQRCYPGMPLCCTKACAGVLGRAQRGRGPTLPQPHTRRGRPVVRTTQTVLQSLIDAWRLEQGWWWAAGQAVGYERGTERHAYGL